MGRMSWMSKPEASAKRAALRATPLVKSVCRKVGSRAPCISAASRANSLPTASEVVSQPGRGDRPDLTQLMLTRANERRLNELLSAVRGAVIEVGQLMLMNAATRPCGRLSFPNAQRLGSQPATSEVRMVMMDHKVTRRVAAYRVRIGSGFRRLLDFRAASAMCRSTNRV